MSSVTSTTPPVKSQIVGQKKIITMLELAADHCLPVLLVGETGTGKTSIIQDRANVRGQQWTRFNLTGDTTVDEFLGKYTLLGGATVWEDGILLQAMKAGHWLIVDEINVALPEILFALHSLLDDDRFVVVAGHNGEVVRPHENFRFFATMNPVEEYAGTKELNKAFASRFPMILEMTYPPKTDEVKIVVQHSGLDKLMVAKMVDVAKVIRGLKADQKVFYTCSTRDLIHWAKITHYTDIETGFTVAILGKALGERKELIQVYDQIMDKYQDMFKSLSSEGLTVDEFEEKYTKITEIERNFEQLVEAGVKSKLQTMLGDGSRDEVAVVSTNDGAGDIPLGLQGQSIGPITYDDTIGPLSSSPF